MDLSIGPLPNMFWVCCLLFCLIFGLIMSVGGSVGFCCIVMLSIKHSSKCIFFLVCVVSRFYANFDNIVVWV